MVLVPATGGMGYEAVKEEFDIRGISYVEAEAPIPIGSDGFCSMGTKECPWNYCLYHKGETYGKHHNTGLELDNQTEICLTQFPKIIYFICRANITYRILIL